MKTFLIVGFRKFGAYPANSAALVIEELRKNGHLADQRIATETLPAEISLDFAYGLFESALYRHADAIVVLGMASDRHGLSVETSACNRVGHPKYHPTKTPEGDPIERGIPFGKNFSLDLNFWKVGQFRKACQKAGVPVEISTDAGGFCCNHLMWKMMRRQVFNHRYRKIPWIFIHIPCSSQSVPKPPEEFYKAHKTTMEPGEVIRGLEILLGNI